VSSARQSAPGAGLVADITTAAAPGPAPGVGTVAGGQPNAHLAHLVLLLALPPSLSSSLDQRRRRLLGWVRLGRQPVVRGLVPGAASSLLDLDLTW
jgi:hypothetical protein